MGRKDEPGLVANIRGQPIRSRTHVPCVHVDEQRMIEPAADVRDVHVSAGFRPQLLPRMRHVLPVLLTAGIGVMSRCYETHSASDPRGVHLSKRVHEQRMPVAHADVHRQAITGSRESLLEAPRLQARKPRYRRDAVENLVMVRHFLDSLGRHTPAAKHSFEERTDIGPPLRTAEGHNQNGLEPSRAAARHIF